MNRYGNGYGASHYSTAVAGVRSYATGNTYRADKTLTGETGSWKYGDQTLAKGELQLPLRLDSFQKQQGLQLRAEQQPVHKNCYTNKAGKMDHQ